MNDAQDTKRGGPIAWMAGNPVAANLLMVVCLGGGLIAGVRIKQEIFPDFDLDMVQVTVPYPGASPEEVEQGIVLAVEERVRGLDGVDEITSTAREGVGTVNVELLLGADRQKAYQDVQQAVARITTFPEDAEEAQVTLVGRRRNVVALALHGDVGEKTLRETGEQVREILLQDPGITQVELSGIRNYEVEVAVPRDALREYGLTLNGIAQRIRHAATELPGGAIKTREGEILLRVKERRDYARQFAQIPVLSLSGGGQVRLGDIATVRDTFEDTDRSASYNGEAAVLVDVYRVGDQTPIQVSDAVRRLVDDLTPQLPPGFSISILNDMSTVYRQRVHLLTRNGLFGLFFVLLLLGAFLETRLAFWVGMGIPVSFLGGIMFMPLLGVSLNMLSMFAFLIALGIVVDDAIVVGENVYEYHQRGMAFMRAAVLGAREVAVPVTFSVLTNVVTFMPLLFVPGFMGKIWRVIPLVVCTVFLISLLECLYILPAHLGHTQEAPRSGIRGALHRLQQTFSHGFSRLVHGVYGPFLRVALAWRYLTVAAGMGILALTVAFVISKRLGVVTMPKVESDYSVVTAVLPYGSAVQRTMAVRDRLSRAAREVAAENGNAKLLEGVFAEIGRPFRSVSGGHIVEVRAYLTEPGVRPISTTRFTELWRQRVGAVPGVEALLFESDRGGPGSGAAITVELSHSDTEILDRASAELAAMLEDFSVVNDVDDGFTPGKVQFDFRMRPEGQALGLTSAEVARQVRDAFYGAEALRQQRGRNEVKVMVRLPAQERVSEYDLQELLIRIPSRADVPLREVATVTRGRAYTSINRRDGRRTVTVSANAQPPKEAGRILDEIRGGKSSPQWVQQIAGLASHARSAWLRWRGRPVPQARPVAVPKLLELQRRYPGLGYSFQGGQRDFAESMDSLATGFIVAVFVIYALLAIPFRSYIQPLIIMVSIPFGIVGAVIGHLIMGYPLSMISMMGIVALSGVVVNDSLVFIDFANRERMSGKNALEAVISAGVRRFRPIMLTTLTTFGGLAPMIFEQSRQARFMVPMAISLGYGILFATGITLLIVPSLYLMVEDAARLKRSVFRQS
jgi:multidrug efflux pump subunit AcrB